MATGEQGEKGGGDDPEARRVGSFRLGVARPRRECAQQSGTCQGGGGEEAEEAHNGSLQRGGAQLGFASYGEDNKCGGSSGG
jgi:hypothetical protein